MIHSTIKNSLAGLIIILAALVSSAQEKAPGDITDIWQVINFDSASNYVNLPASAQNIWQIGKPQKSFFDSAYSAPDAIITDTMAYYPVNANSWFDIYRGEFNCGFFPFDIIFDFWHKFDTDTLRDGGYITVSWDNGATWMNVIGDTQYWYGMTPPYSYCIPNPNLYLSGDTLFNGEPGFSGHSNGWQRTILAWHGIPIKSSFDPDTMILRFHFISDSIPEQREGWMIDNLRMYSIDLGGGLADYDRELVSVFPNPFSGSTTIVLDRPYETVRILVTDMQGKLVATAQARDCSRLSLGMEGAAPGIYFLKAVLDNKSMLGRTIVVSE